MRGRHSLSLAIELLLSQNHQGIGTSRMRDIATEFFRERQAPAGESRSFIDGLTTQEFSGPGQDKGLWRLRKYMGGVLDGTPHQPALSAMDFRSQAVRLFP